MLIDGGDCARIGRAMARGDRSEYQRVERFLTPPLKAEIQRWRDGIAQQQQCRPVKELVPEPEKGRAAHFAATSVDLDYWADTAPDDDDDDERLPEDDGETGISEEQEICPNCGGEGCEECNWTGRVGDDDDEDGDENEEE
jgi:hypothetical protein